jgi:uncharacterized protein (DUF2147 family)
MSFRSLAAGRVPSRVTFPVRLANGLSPKPVLSASRYIEASQLHAGVRRSVAWLRVIVMTGLLCAFLVAVSNPSRSAGVPQGIWLIDGKVAVQIFDCSSRLCGRIVWLRAPRDAAGDLHTDNKNPDLALRSRLVCGLTILEGLQASGPGRWKNGRFYNPEDGRWYNVTAELKSPDMMVARIYLGVPFLGETKVLRRIPDSSTAGWC